MTSNNFTTRFAVGKTYRLHTSPELPNYRDGTLTVVAELSPRDQWGSRVLLADVSLYPTGGGRHQESRLGVRVYVEEGYTEVTDSYGSKTIPVEIATVQGLYPHNGKAYANAELCSSRFTPIRTSRVA